MSTPAFKLVFDGNDVTDLVKDRLVSLRLTDDQGQQSDNLEISLDDRDKLLPVPRSGAWIKVWLGYAKGPIKPVYMGTFSVDEVGLSMGGPRTMTIKATAANTAPKLIKEKVTKSWDGKTLGQITQEIAKKHGLEPVIKGTAASAQIKHEDQTNESDQSFLTRLAERFKATIKPADGKLILVDRGAGQAGAVIQVDVTQVSDWRATLKNRGAFSKVRAKYVEREKGGGVSEWSNVEKVVQTEDDGSKLPVFEIKRLYPTKAEAEKAANSKLQSLRAGEVKITFKMRGAPEFKFNAEGKISLKNFRDQVDGEWIIKTVTHELSGSGFTTTVDCGTPGDENGDWSTGKGKNDGASSSEKASLLSGAAASAKGMSTTGGPGNGNLACQWAVNKVMRNAGVSPPWGNSNYVPDALSALQKSATQVSSPVPGAIAIMSDSAGPVHIGIVQGNGNILSNSSSKGTFSWDAPASSYSSYYGRQPQYFLLK